MRGEVVAEEHAALSVVPPTHDPAGHQHRAGVARPGAHRDDVAQCLPTGGRHGRGAGARVGLRRGDGAVAELAAMIDPPTPGLTADLATDPGAGEAVAHVDAAYLEGIGHRHGRQVRHAAIPRRRHVALGDPPTHHGPAGQAGDVVPIAGADGARAAHPDRRGRRSRSHGSVADATTAVVSPTIDGHLFAGGPAPCDGATMIATHGELEGAHVLAARLAHDRGRGRGATSARGVVAELAIGVGAPAEDIAVRPSRARMPGAERDLDHILGAVSVDAFSEAADVATGAAVQRIGREPHLAAGPASAHVAFVGRAIGRPVEGTHHHFELTPRAWDFDVHAAPGDGTAVHASRLSDQRKRPDEHRVEGPHLPYGDLLAADDLITDAAPGDHSALDASDLGRERVALEAGAPAKLSRAVIPACSERQRKSENGFEPSTHHRHPGATSSQPLEPQVARRQRSGIEQPGQPAVPPSQQVRVPSQTSAPPWAMQEGSRTHAP